MNTAHLKVMTLPQADGVTRYLAISDPDYRAVRRDPSMIDSVPVAACLDVERDGSATWQRHLEQCVDTPAGRNAIRAARAM